MEKHCEKPARLGISRATRWCLLRLSTYCLCLVAFAGAASADNGEGKPKTNWSCMRKDNKQYVGDVAIWWGHTAKDASWACGQWISTCGNNGGCNAQPKKGGSGGGGPGGQAQEFLDAHNRVRGEYGAPPLKWSASLAAEAQKWANHLASSGQFEHSGAGAENLAMRSGGRASPSELVGQWIDERSKFRKGTFPNVSSTGAWEDVGHFTQVIWRGTTTVGCGIGTRGDTTILVCRYDPAGNVLGAQVP